MDFFNVPVCVCVFCLFLYTRSYRFRMPFCWIDRFGFRLISQLHLLIFLHISLSHTHTSVLPLYYFLPLPISRYDTGLKKPNRRIDALDQILSTQDYLLSDGFSTADVAVASYLLYVPQFFGSIDLSRWPNVVRYMKRCAERPKYAEAFGTQVQQSLVGALDGMMGDGDKPKKNWLGL